MWILSPATISVTPVLVTTTVSVIALAATFIPDPLMKVGYGVAHANSWLKFCCVLVNAVYSESLFGDSLGKPTLIFCCPEMLILYPYLIVFIKKDWLLGSPHHVLGLTDR